MKTSARISGATLLLAVAIGCRGAAPARPQWVVTISSDVPIPSFADQLLVELVDPDGGTCGGCARTFALTDETSLPLSLGVEPGDDPQPRVRATLFRRDQAGEDGRPIDAAHLEALGRLPSANGVEAVSLELPMRCFGVPADPGADTTCDPATGMPAEAPTLSATAALATGSWAPATPVECATSAPSDMVCVPGGVFLMGSPTVVSIGDGLAAYPEHLVELPPFFLDVTEVTVKTVRDLLAGGTLDASATPTARVTGPSALSELAGGCTFTPEPCADCNDAWPVSCITQSQAAAICASLGKRLPTEAEWEYAARNLSTESTYPWGEDTNLCADAAVSRGRGAEVTVGSEDDACRTGDGGELAPGPVPVGTTPDVTALGVHDMGGNVAEWLSDALQTYDDACWSGGTPQLANPHCMTASSSFAGDVAVRGGGWTLAGVYAASAMRNFLPASTSLPGYGVRCAKTP